MAKDDNDFRAPVFVRKDDSSDISASVVLWGKSLDNSVSVRIEGANGSVLINSEDWATLVSCVNAELHKVT